jgi:ribosome-associated protein
MEKPIRMEGTEKAQWCAHYADNKKAEDIAILDVRGLSTITDFFVVCTAHSSPQLRATRDEIDVRMKEDHGIKSRAKDGSFESTWIILDFSDVLVHIFQGDQRDFYALEDLWSDAPRVPFDAEEMLEKEKALA